MMRVILALTTLILLAACGADGDPVAPGATATGEATIGVVSR